MTTQESLLLAAVLAVQQQPQEPKAVEAIVEQAVEVVPDADHVSLTVRRRGEYVTLAGTTEWGLEVDQIQYDLHEGPCLDALHEGEWFRSGDIARDARWPRWGPRAAALGVRSMCSFRLTARGETVGALNVYSREQGGFADPDAMEMAALYVMHAAYALSSARLVTGLETAMGSRHLIGLAQGILMERFELDAATAFAVLRRLSSVQNRKLRELAEELVETGDLTGLQRPDEAG